VKQLAQLAAALMRIGVSQDETWRIVRKAGWDSVPGVRRAVIDVLSRQTEPVAHAVIEEESGLPNKVVGRAVEDLVALELARRQKDSGKWYVQQTAIARDYWDCEAFPGASEGEQNSISRGP
jgi:hypothetical protein